MNALVAYVLSGVLLATTLASAEVGIRREQIQIRKGAARVTIKGKIRGDQMVDYQLRAGVGQSMVVIFKPSNRSAYFNVMPPGSDVAMFVGSISGNRFEAELPADGVQSAST